MSSKIQPFVYNNTGDEEKKVLELKDEPKFSKIEDPFFDDEDIELFDEENLVTLELKDEKRVARLTTTLFNRSNEGHDKISLAKTNQEKFLLKNRTRRYELLSWYAYSTAFGLIYAVAIGFFIPLLLRELAISHACPYEALPTRGTKKSCNFFLMDSALLGSSFANMTIFEEYVSRAKYPNFYNMHGKTLLNFFNINKEGDGSFQTMTTTTTATAPPIITTTSPTATTIFPMPNVTTKTTDASTTTGMTQFDITETKIVTRLEQLEPVIKSMKEKNTIKKSMANLTKNLCIKATEISKMNLSNTTNVTGNVLMQLPGINIINATYPLNRTNNTSNVSSILPCFTCIRPVPLLASTANNSLDVITALDMSYIYMKNLTDDIIAHYFPILTLSNGYNYVEHDGHLNESTTCKINPFLNWTELGEIYDINYSYWMQWPDMNESSVRENNNLVNYTCSDTAKKLNATYALTVQQNVTFNSTVYDTDEHATLELEFVIYNNSHPCNTVMNCTPEAIFSISEPRNYSDTSGMEAWREDNISFPYALNLSHVEINVSVTSTNHKLVPDENIIVTRSRFGLFYMEITPLPFRTGSTSITVEILTKTERNDNLTNATNVTIYGNTTNHTHAINRDNMTNATNHNIVNSNNVSLFSNHSGHNCTNATYAAYNWFICFPPKLIEPPQTFDLELFQKDTHGLKYQFTLRVNKTVCAHEVKFLIWRIKARDFPQHVFFVAFLVHLVITILFGGIGDYCCMRKIGMSISSSLASLALMSFFFWTTPKQYEYAGVATIATVSGLGLAAIYYNALFARLVQSDKIAQEKLTLLGYESDIIPFNTFQQSQVDLMSNYSLVIAYITGTLGLVASLFYIIWEASSYEYAFPFYFRFNVFHPGIGVMSRIVFACGGFIGLNTLVIFLFSWCRWGHKCKKMPIWSNIVPPISWPLFSLHKYFQILIRPKERKLIQETGKGLMLLFVGFFCINTFTFCWKIYLSTEFDFDKNMIFFLSISFSILVQLSCILWLRCARQCQRVFGVEHIDMFLLATIVFQIVTCYAIFAGFPQIPFGLKLVEEFIPYLFIQSFSKAIFEAYGRTWYMKIIPAGYDSQFFTLYQNAVGIGHSWSGSKWADFVFEQNGSIMVMNTFLFLFIMLMNFVFCCACLSIKKGRTNARLLRRLIRRRPPARSWKHLNEQIKNRYANQKVSHEQMYYLINLTHMTINLLDIVEPFKLKYPKVLKSNIKRKIREISVIQERDPSPFFYYQKQVRPRLQARLSNLSKEEITQKIHKLWENLEPEERQNYLDEAERQKGNDRNRYYVKDEILWNYRFSKDLKKLPEFLKPITSIQRIYRGWITRKRLKGDIKPKPTRCQRCTKSVKDVFGCGKRSKTREINNVKKND